MGLDRLLLAASRRALLPFVRFTTAPEDAARRHAAVGRPLCYVLQVRQLSSLLVLEEATARLGLPRALNPLRVGARTERSSFFFLTRSGQPSPLQPNPYRYSERLERIVAAVEEDADCDVNLLPVSIFWGRAPSRQETFIKALFADAWAAPGAVRQLVRIGIHGRQTLVKFGEPISLREVMRGAATEGLERPLALRRVARLLRAQFRRERELAVGPNLSHRQTLVNDLVGSPPVRQAIAEEAQRGRITVRKAELQARRHAYRIASDYSYAIVRAGDIALTALWNRIYGGVEAHHFDEVSAVGSGAGLVYVPCHRSHIDYLLLSYLLYERGLTPPHIAAGDNLDMPVVGSILRRGGAFFLRRSFKGDELYGAVFSEYLHTILSRGFPIEYFVEGGRSRTGRMLPPKAGMLAMTVDSFLRGATRPLVFVPVYIGYEQIMEGESYVAELTGRPKERESLIGLLSSLRKLHGRFGRVHVNVGRPLALEGFLDARWPSWRAPAEEGGSPREEAKRGAVGALAVEIVSRINDALVVNPVNLVALAMLGTPRGAMDAAQLIRHVDLLAQLLAEVPYSERQVLAARDGPSIVAYAEQLGLLERIAHPLGDILRVPGDRAPLIAYYRNNVLHAFAVPGLIARLLAQNARVGAGRLRVTARRLFPIMRAELFLSWTAEDLDRRLDAYLALFERFGLLRASGGWLVSPSPASGESVMLRALAQLIRPLLERYLIAVATLARFGSGELSARSLEDCCVLLGQRIAYLHDSGGPEFPDRGAFRSIIRALIDVGLAAELEGRLVPDPALPLAAEDAELLLPEETRNAIAHVSQVSEADMKRAVAAQARAG